LVPACAGVPYHAEASTPGEACSDQADGYHEQGLRRFGGRSRTSSRGRQSEVHRGFGGNEIDIALYADVLRRHRSIVIVGVALTVALALFSYVRVSPSGISYRSAEVWSNQATLQLTQEGAPELRSVLPPGPGGTSPLLADTGRFASLIDLYATLATSDAVVNELKRRGLLTAEDLRESGLPITAAAVPSPVGVATPMMTITANSVTGPKATRLTVAATKAFLDVVQARQRAARIPAKDRIQIRVLSSSEPPTLVDPRNKALPILVLLGGLIATVAVAFTRDNLRRRERVQELAPVASPPESPMPDSVDDGSRSPGPVRLPESAPARESSGATHGGSRRRLTLGSVADEPARQSRRG
jgi:hypothetical protein